VAPPKRKTTGRVTPKGTRPGQSPAVARSTTQAGAVSESSRYTPPVANKYDESPRWVPVLMAILIGIAVVLILLRYLVWDNSNLPFLLGLVFLLAGLFTATKWK
jgi:hypothetical protein